MLYILSVGLPGLVLAACCRLPSRLYYVPVSWLLGTGLVTGELFLYFVVLRLPVSSWLSIGIGIQAAVALAWLFVRRRHAFTATVAVTRPRLATALAGSLIVILVALSLLQAVVKPVVAFDAVTFWSLRSKILETDGRVDFNPESFTYLAATSHRNYPWHVSLSEYWLRHTGAGAAALNVIPWSAFVSLLGLAYVFLRRRSSGLIASVLTLFLASMPFMFYHSFNSYADLTLAAYALGAFVFLGEWLSSRRLSLLLVSAVLAGWCFFVKNEGIFYILAWIVGFGIASWQLRPRRREIMLASIALIGPILPWIAVKLLLNLGLRNTPAAPGWYPQVGEYIIQAFGLVNNWNVWWYLFIAVLIIRFSALVRHRREWPLWAFFAVSGMITAAMYFFTENYTWALDHTALSRTMIALVPVSVILSGLLIKEERP